MAPSYFPRSFFNRCVPLIRSRNKALTLGVWTIVSLGEWAIVTL